MNELLAVNCTLIKVKVFMLTSDSAKERITRGPWNEPRSLAEAADALEQAPALYQHDDGRYALALGDAARHRLTDGDPGWHRVPLDVVETDAATPAAQAVDLEQFREAVIAWSDAIYEATHNLDHPTILEADRLLQLIDQQAGKEQAANDRRVSYVCPVCAASMERQG